MDTVQQWTVYESALAAERAYADPFAIGPVATFEGPTGATLAVRGFWDGGNVWRIRFAPPAPGLWRWHVENPANTHDAGLHGQSGELLCLAADGDNTLHQHGFLRVAPSGRTLEHADGVPFFWLGDTVWRLNYASPDEVDAYAAQRQAQGFNVACYFVAEPIPNTDLLKLADYRPAARLPGVDYFAPSIYQERVDSSVRLLNRHGLVVFLQGLWRTEFADWGLERCIAYWRYLVARYGAYHVLWSVSGEWDDCPPDVARELAGQVRALGQIIKATDPYHHPITVHPLNGTSSGRTFHVDEWLSYNVQQSRATSERTVVQLPREDYERQPAKPNIDAEHIYEGEERGNAALVRWTAYVSVLQGALVGHTYGAHGVWDWNTRARFPHAPLALLNLPGAEQMEHFAALFRSLPGWPLLQPHREWARGDTAVDPNDTCGPFCAAQPGVLYVVYAPPGVGQLTLTHLGQGSYRARWFSPRSGAWRQIESCIPVADAWTAPPPPDDGDWVLVLDHP